ncbi:cytochrome c [Schlesneria sp. DSM 10557]|uniref:c-type cytochrome n=1 Tax=Schlesneria sp. DSM 10557 TaxID=3044399 RepID=UPI00359F9B31
MLSFRCQLVFVAVILTWWSHTPSTFADVNFTKEIAPIIFENCATCHRPGEAAPFPLLTYADVQERGDLIADVVKQRLMPPWKAEPADYPFLYERRLSKDQIELITNWVDQGMPEGNAADLPALPEFASGWTLGEPDLVVSMKQPYRVPADGPDIYRNFTIPLDLTEEHFIAAIAFRPSARSVVHHSLFFFDATGRGRELEAEDDEPGFKGGMGAMMKLRGSPVPPQAFDDPETAPKRSPLGKRATPGAPAFGALGGWALGAQPHLLPNGLAYRVPAGSDLILATHFHPSGKAEEETSTVGIYFAKKPSNRRFMPIQLPPAFGAFKGIDIPPGEKEYVIEDTFVLPVDVEAFGVGAHAHYLGKSMTLTATLPDGTRRTILSIPDWDFAWQEQYRFAEFAKLPKGTRLHSRITYDNSKDNPRNPSDPPARVHFGEESTDEMGSISLMTLAADESELPLLQSAYRTHFRSALLKSPLSKLFQGRLEAE